MDDWIILWINRIRLHRSRKIQFGTIMNQSSSADPACFAVSLNQSQSTKNNKLKVGLGILLLQYLRKLEELVEERWGLITHGVLQLKDWGERCSFEYAEHRTLLIRICSLINQTQSFRKSLKTKAPKTYVVSHVDTFTYIWD